MSIIPEHLSPRQAKFRDEITPGLWIGSYSSILNYQLLKEDNISHVVSVTGGKLSMHPSLTRYQIDVEDAEYTDLLVHLPPAIAFIQDAMSNGEGVLVHCQAGISRSVSVVAAYLMFTKDLDFSTALNMIRDARPIANPNDSFIRQLELFRAASCTITNEDKAVRSFYLERAVQDVRAGRKPGLKFLATHDPVASASTAGNVQRRIRCKMCRRELAIREHIMDHGQLNGSRSYESGADTTDAGSPLQSQQQSDNSAPALDTRRSALRAATTSERIMQSLTAAEKSTAGSSSLAAASSQTGALGGEMMLNAVNDRIASVTSTSLPGAARLRTRRKSYPPPSRPPVLRPTSKVKVKEDDESVSGTGAILDGLRTTSGSGDTPPVMIGPKCSGYFLEPMKWMDPLLANGLLEGKIVCPNSKCGVKLGNYAWAGVQCNCKQWVTPGFCIHPTKVDEIW